MNNKIDRYEKTQYKKLKLWELKDRLNITRPIVSVYNLPDDISEEIIDYTLKLIEEGEWNMLKDDCTMIDYKLLLHDIKDTKEEFEKLISISFKV